MNGSFLLLLLFIGSCSKGIVTGAPERTSITTKHQARHSVYQAALNRFHQEDDAPGTLLAIKKGSNPVWIGALGYSNIEDSIRMTPGTPFRTGSITKVFTAVLILQLKEQGKLALDDPFTKYLPQLQNKIRGSEAVTIRHLLNHTSGIADPRNDDPVYLQQIRNEPETIGSMDMAERLQRFVFGKPLRFIPGSASYYSNAGYWILGLLVEQIARQRLQELLEKRIFRPAGMSATYYEKRNNPAVSKGYTPIGESLVEVSRWDAADGDADPGSGIISTADDLIRFGQALFGGKLIHTRSLMEMKQIAQTPDCRNDCSYGLGIESWNTQHLAGYGKNGTSVGVDANLIFFPEKNTMLVLFKNNGNGSHKDFIETVVLE